MRARKGFGTKEGKYLAWEFGMVQGSESYNDGVEGVRGRLRGGRVEGRPGEPNITISAAQSPL